MHFFLQDIFLTNIFFLYFSWFLLFFILTKEIFGCKIRDVSAYIEHVKDSGDLQMNQQAVSAESGRKGETWTV